MTIQLRPIQINIKPFPRSAFVFINTSSARLVCVKMSLPFFRLVILQQISLADAILIKTKAL